MLTKQRDVPPEPSMCRVQTADLEVIILKVIDRRPAVPVELSRLGVHEANTGDDMFLARPNLAAPPDRPLQQDKDVHSVEHRC